MLTQLLTTQSPTKTGWHLINFANGDAAVVRWNGNDWVWGSLNEPTSPIIGIHYLGNTVSDFSTSGTGIANWTNALASVPGKVEASLMAELDRGALQQGQPVLIDSSGNTVSGEPSQGTSEALATSLIPGLSLPHISLPNFTALLNLKLWKGIGLVLAGAAILIFAAIELKNI